MSARLACGNINIGGRGWYNFVIPFSQLALILQQISGASVYLHSGLHFSLVKPLYIAMWLHCLSILQNAFKRIRNHSNITKSAYTNPHPIPTPSPCTRSIEGNDIFLFFVSQLLNLFSLRNLWSKAISIFTLPRLNKLNVIAIKAQFSIVQIDQL